MKKRKWGRIVNIASIWSKKSRKYRAAYASSKFGLDGLTISIAAEYTSMGILANCVSPGFINTELTQKILGKKGIEELMSAVPINRLGKPNEIGIDDITKPTWGHSPRNLLDDEVNVFWACGVTPQNAILNSNIPLCISHTPGYMLITDVQEDAEIPILQ